MRKEGIVLDRRWEIVVMTSVLCGVWFSEVTSVVPTLLYVAAFPPLCPHKNCRDCNQHIMFSPATLVLHNRIVAEEELGRNGFSVLHPLLYATSASQQSCMVCRRRCTPVL
ncbi:unnamed protein product [Ectocarpus sp. 6 AP-2014]